MPASSEVRLGELPKGASFRDGKGRVWTVEGPSAGEVGVIWCVCEDVTRVPQRDRWAAFVKVLPEGGA